MRNLLEAAKENLSFLGVCVLIFAALFAVAYLVEKFVLKDRVKKISRGRYVAFIGVFSAIAGLLMYIEIPLFFAPSFYQMDLSEIPVMICTFYLGPVAGVVSELVKIIVKLVLKGTSTAFVGDFANFVVGCSLVLPASIIYHVRKTKKTALLGMGVGTAVMTVFGSLFNAVYLLPRFATLYGIPLDAIIAMGTEVNGAINSVSTLVLFAVVPFNLLKGVVVTAVTMLLYKRVERVFFRRTAKPTVSHAKT